MPKLKQFILYGPFLTQFTRFFCQQKLDNKGVKWILNIFWKKKDRISKSEYLVQKIILKKYFLR